MTTFKLYFCCDRHIMPMVLKIKSCGTIARWEDLVLDREKRDAKRTSSQHVGAPTHRDERRHKRTPGCKYCKKVQFTHEAVIQVVAA